jgi:hypothetical protein
VHVPCTQECARSRSSKATTGVCAILRSVNKAGASSFKNYSDLLNFVQEHKLPDKVDEFAPFDVYAVDKLAQDFERYPNTMATVLVTKVTVGWIGQLVSLGRPWALHGDGTHKFHIGGWPVTTLGTHCLAWDSKAKVCRQYSLLCVVMQ